MGQRQDFPPKKMGRDGAEGREISGLQLQRRLVGSMSTSSLRSPAAHQLLDTATSAPSSKSLRPRLVFCSTAPELENSRRKEEKEDEGEEQDSTQTTESLSSGASDTPRYG